MQVRTLSARRSFAGLDSFSVVAQDRPPRLRRRRGTGVSLMRAAACAGIALGMAAMVANFLSGDAGGGMPISAPGPTASPASAKPTWIEVNHPIQLYDLAGSELGKLPLAYRAKRMSDASARQDSLIYGGFGDGAPYLNLSVLRTVVAELPASGSSLLVHLARLGAEAGLAVTHIGPAIAVPTRFGVFATADITVEHGQDAAPCLGFRLQDDAAGPAPIGIAGFACGTASKAMDRGRLACILDRIDLVSAGDDEAMRAFFVEAERRRGHGCAGSPLLPAGPRSTWLDGPGTLPSFRRVAGGAGKMR
jgi:hypothetical protein